MEFIPKYLIAKEHKLDPTSRKAHNLFHRIGEVIVGNKVLIPAEYYQEYLINNAKAKKILKEWHSYPHSHGVGIKKML